MKRISLALVAVCTLGLAGCGTLQQPGGEATLTPLKEAAPLDVALVTAQFGWVLTPDQFLVSRDGGATLTPLDVPVSAGSARAAHFTDASTGVVASADGASLTVAATSDGGQTWRTTTVLGQPASPAGYSSLVMSFAGKEYGAILARSATSQAFSHGTLFATTDGGASWSASPAPEAGQVGVEPAGRIWLAGAALHSTVDQGQNWVQSELALAGEITAATVSAPVAGRLPVTVINDDGTEVQLLTTTDSGRTWGNPVRLPVQGGTGAGVRLAVAGTPDGPVVYDNVAGHAYRENGVDLQPAGLTDGLLTVTFAADGQQGWALAGYGTCASDKQNCQYHHNLLTTSDHGATWNTVADWSRAA